MKRGPPRDPRARAAALGWTIHPRLTDDDTGRGELLGEAFVRLAELDDRSLETWVQALRARGGR